MSTARGMTMTAQNPGDWTGPMLGALTIIGGGILWLRKWLRKDGVDSAGDGATLRVINMLRDELDRANARNDALLKALGESNRQIDDLRAQVVRLTAEVEGLRAQLERP